MAKLTAERERQASVAYERVAGSIAAGRCVVLDGATATELPGVAGDRPKLDDRLWGTSALIDSPADVLAVHRRYVEVGCPR